MRINSGFPHVGQGLPEQPGSVLTSASRWRFDLLGKGIQKPRTTSTHQLAVGDLIQLLFHARREPQVDDFGEVIDQQVDDHLPDLRGH
jgi:hypothetical protein